MWSSLAVVFTFKSLLPHPGLSTWPTLGDDAVMSDAYENNSTVAV